MANGRDNERLAFGDLTPREKELLRGLRPMLKQALPEITEAFYARLLDFPETAALLQDPTTVERLKHFQRNYLHSLTEGECDATYCANRMRMGQTHERIGLHPQWFLLAYSIYFQILAPIIQRHLATDPDRLTNSLMALQKAFLFDASLALESYIASERHRHLQQLDSIVNDSADVIIMLDQKKRFRAWNRAAERIFGWTRAEILGQPVQVIVPARVLQSGELEQIDKIVNQQGFCHLETIRQAKDGRLVPVELTTSLLRDPQGKPLGRSVILRDITERKRLEEAKLQTERLATIGAMSAKLAHEIRNPLSSIILNIELVHDEIDTLAKAAPEGANEARTLLRALESEVRRVQRVTEDYLAFARLPRLEREWVALNDVLQPGLAFMQSLFDASKVRLECDFATDLPPLLVDEAQLWQAILNIIRNALEAMPKGGTLYIRTARAGADVLLTIRDTGRGMTELARQELFKPFFSTKSGGTGLGLPLTQQIITEHGGRIECQSVEGQGTTFLIYLPCPAGS